MSKQYRMLKAGEVILTGDECRILADPNDPWDPTWCPGNKYNPDSGYIYRRPVDTVTFHVPIYDCEVTISISKVLPSDVAGLKPSPDDQEFFDDSTAVAFKNGLSVLVAFKPGLLSHDTIAHELFHVTHYILSRANVRITKKSDEAHAYLAGFLAKETYKAIKQITKERIK